MSFWFQLIFVYFGTTQFPVLKRSDDEKYFRDVTNERDELFPSLDDSYSVKLSVIIPAYEEQDRRK